MIGTDNRLYFNARGAGGEWTAGSTTGPAPVGRKIQITGIRYRTRRVELYIDGVRQPAVGAAPAFSYGKPTQVRIGTLYNGSAPFQGRLYDFAVYSGVVGAGPEWAGTLAEFLKP
jgi:hypothetical protein